MLPRATVLTRAAAVVGRHARQASSSTEASSSSSMTEKIGEQLADKNRRLFAIVFINGRQWKVTCGDVIQLEGAVPLDTGDQIKLDKVLAIGSASFSLFGRPLLSTRDVQVDATVVERCTKYPELYYRRFNHYQTRITNWRTTYTTLLRIDSVHASPSLLEGRSSDESIQEAKTSS